MKIAIVGAGIVGVTTAYELASDGHEVTVFEQRSAAAEEASFATGALVAPGWTADWTFVDSGRVLATRSVSDADARRAIASGAFAGRARIPLSRAAVPRRSRSSVSSSLCRLLCSVCALITSCCGASPTR